MKTVVTPDVEKWILDHSAHHPTSTLWTFMIQSGWSKEMSADVLSQVLKVNVPDAFSIKKEIPFIHIDENSLNAGDRTVSVLAIIKEPQIVVLGNVLSPEECDELISMAQPKMARSQTVAATTGKDELNDVRTSNGMFFTKQSNHIVAALEKRISILTNWPEENGEGLQILQYKPGAEYKPHYDYFDPVSLGSTAILKRGGQRVGTFIVYLEEPEKGGGTLFPDVNFEVLPKKGNAVFFSYSIPHPSSKSLHAGTPVIKGEKWIATKWLRENKFI